MTEIPPFAGNIGFNAHHSPMGAYFSFTCGHFGTRGGMAAQLGKPGGQNLYIGIKEGPRFEPSSIRCLPFFEGASGLMQQTGETAFVMEKVDGEIDPLTTYGTGEMARRFGWATDTWKTEDFQFSIFTPFDGIPEPTKSNDASMRAALLPAVVAEVVIDNLNGKTARTAFVAVNFNEGGARILDEGLSRGRVGFALRGQYGVAAEVEGDGVPFAFMRWGVQQGLEDRANPVHLLGDTPGVGVEVPAGKRAVLRLVFGCYLDGMVTTRLGGRYLYTKYFRDLAAVLNEGLNRFVAIREASEKLDRRLVESGLSADQQFLIAHATRSYYGNTQLLEVDGEPYWVVNEGEYCMMNTLDLAVDQMFWELERNPWVVRNLLDGFVRHYRYEDQVKASAGVVPGGISFCHDQGAHNQFSPFGHSSYELPGLTGCFSYMTMEQLCNWVLMAASYVAHTSDLDWLVRNEAVIESCYQSMSARSTGGLMDRDSARCGTGCEITTYDSLDPTLGKARGSAYLGVKTWATYLGLEFLGRLLFEHSGEKNLTIHGKSPIGNEVASPWDDAESAGLHMIQSKGAAEHVPNVWSTRVLPAIEALIYPLRWSEESRGWVTGGAYRGLIDALRTQCQTMLADPERGNHFSDGGIRLSAGSDNSWVSKIAIVQQVAREAFNFDERGGERAKRGAGGWETADAAHVRWLTTGKSAYWAASDQFVNGEAQGSRYYPRLITCALWLAK